MHDVETQEPSTKVCCKCQQAKPLDAFYKSSKAKDGLRPRCKDCGKEDYLERNQHRQRRMPTDPTGKTKWCNSCKQYKDRATEFWTNSDRGQQTYCKECSKATSSKYHRDKVLKKYDLPADYEGSLVGKANSRPEGSTFVDGSGYVREKQTGHHRADAYGWVMQHLLVAETKYGFPITPDFTVHHRNDCRSDNYPSNLELRVGQHGRHGDIIPTLLARSEERAIAIAVLEAQGYTVTKAGD